MTLDYETHVGILRAQLMEWKQGIPSESSFWDMWIKERGGQWAEAFQKRFDPETPLDPWIAAAARSLKKQQVSILDVGSGPVPVIGYKLEGLALRITAVDPLASIYNSLLARQGLCAPVTPTFAPAEELSSFFEPNSFDIAHCRNALDHSFDPLRGIREMLKVVVVGGFVLLRHFRNEAEHGEYKGFHHYNFDCRDNRFVIWNKSMMVDVADFLAPRAEVFCAMPGQVDVIIRKVSDTPESSNAPRERMGHYLQAFIDVIAG
jgi:SAM-dependent methyltransferase